MRWTIVIILVLGMGRVPAAAWAQPPAQPDRNQIVTTGNGEVTVTPDQATLSAGAQAQRQTAAEAVTEVNRVATAIIGRWQQIGIRREDIRTASIQVFPVYSTPREGAQQQITGYRAFYGLTATVRDLTLVGRAVDAAVEGGAGVLQGLSFGLRDPSRARNQALAMAVREAREKAEAIAAAAGLRIRGIERIVEEGGEVGVREQRLAPAAAAPTPIEPGTLTVTARVTVVFGY